MKRLFNLCLISLLILGLASAAVAQTAAPPAPAAAPPAGQPAEPPPPPAVANKVGDIVRGWEAKILGTSDVLNSSKLANKSYALVFVNSSCSSCRAELTELRSYEFGDKLVIHIVSVDMNPERAFDIYKNAYQMPFPILDDSTYELGKLFDFSFTPATAIIGADGKLAFRIGGYSSRTKAAFEEAFGKYGKKK